MIITDFEKIEYIQKRYKLKNIKAIKLLGKDKFNFFRKSLSYGTKIINDIKDYKVLTK